MIVDRSLVFTTSAMFTIAIGLLLWLVVRDRRQRASTGSEGMIGEAGIAVGDLSPDGKVKVHGEIWNAVGEGEIHAGDRVRVDEVEGLVLRVSKKRRELR